ncbi:MAG: hypothetical protein BWY06_02200 [Candidatus Latescibacteria bacterium ADurb.Bin168]|nr:MAG: hypothetical protein BWY06_02200 [Candidatus Latescibacteria bacterium ADurb.Bin168]
MRLVFHDGFAASAFDIGRRREIGFADRETYNIPPLTSQPVDDREDLKSVLRTETTHPFRKACFAHGSGSFRQSLCKRSG